MFCEPSASGDRWEEIVDVLHKGLVAVVKTSVQVVAAPVDTVHWGSVVEAMERDAREWVQQDALVGQPVSCLDTLQREWSDLLQRCGGQRNVSAKDMRRLVARLPVATLVKGDE